MTKHILPCVSMLALVVAVVPASTAPQAARENCEARISKLEESKAEGTERLAEKNEVIGLCDRQYKRDKTVQALVKECAKYIEQPVLKQQFVAECQIAAFNYANALQMLKAEYRK